MRPAKLSLEHRQAISAGLQGRVVTAETRRKIGLANSIALKGKKVPEAVKAKIRSTHRRLGIMPPCSGRGAANPHWKGGPAVIKQTLGYRMSRANTILKYKYGITLAEYEAMVSAQDGKCKICRYERKLYIDHDHATQKIRGLLCRGCNCAIGFLGDSIESLQRAIEYLQQL